MHRMLTDSFDTSSLRSRPTSGASNRTYAHPNTLEPIKNLIDLCEAWGKPEKAAQWLEDNTP